METGEFEIEAADGALTVRGNKRAEPDGSPKTYRITERVLGAFERVVVPPKGIDPTQILANVVNGILTISMLSPVHGGRKEIPIAAGSLRQRRSQVISSPPAKSVNVRTCCPPRSACFDMFDLSHHLWNGPTQYG